MFLKDDPLSLDVPRGLFEKISRKSLDSWFSDFLVDFLIDLETRGSDSEGNERSVLKRVFEMSRDSSSLSVMVSFIASLEVQKFAENLPFQEEQVTCQEKVNGMDRRFFADRRRRPNCASLLMGQGA